MNSLEKARMADVQWRLRKAEERLAQAAAQIAALQEIVASYRKLGDDITVRFMALAESMREIK